MLNDYRTTQAGKPMGVISSLGVLGRHKLCRATIAISSRPWAGPQYRVNCEQFLRERQYSEASVKRRRWRPLVSVDCQNQNRAFGKEERVLYRWCFAVAEDQMSDTSDKGLSGLPRLF